MFLAPELTDAPADAAPGARLRLRASWCDGCARAEFPACDSCPVCRRPMTPTSLGPDATLVGYTAVLHPAPGALVDAPYFVGVARFEEGVAVLGLLVGLPDLESAASGMALEVIVVAFADGRSGYGFRPSAAFRSR